MIVLYVILWVLLGLLALIFLLTLVPVRAKLCFQGEFELTVKYLFLRFPLLPGEPGKKPEEPEEEKKEEEPEEQKKPGAVDRVKAALKREGLGGFLQALGELIKLLAEASAGIIRRIKLKSFDLYLCAAGAQDAAAGALMYGKISAGVYSACGVLFKLLPCRKRGVTVDLDYGREEALVDFSAELSIRPFFVLAEGLRLLLKGWRPLKRII